jgi:hypothetical protein
MSASVNLNQILGVESNGIWDFPDDVNGVVALSVTPSSAKFGSSMIFNAQKAYADGEIWGGYEVAGNPKKQAFKFQYITAKGTVFDFTIVVGEK